MSDELIAAMREREKALRARIAQKTAELQKRKARDRKRDAGDLGEGLLNADESGAIPPDLKTTIKAIIVAAGGLEDRQKRRLKERGGWV
jgi:hypothetical protein